MPNKSVHLYSIISYSILYNILFLFVNFIPNPAVPNGYIAVNMIIPVVAGYLLGPMSGFLVGAFGVSINALINASPITVTAIFPVMVMGYLAGYIGKSRNIVIASLTIIVGHGLNILYFYRHGLIEIQNIPLMSLSILSESAFDTVLIVMLLSLSSRKYYQKERW